MKNALITIIITAACLFGEVTIYDDGEIFPAMYRSRVVDSVGHVPITNWILSDSAGLHKCVLVSTEFEHKGPAKKDIKNSIVVENTDTCKINLCNKGQKTPPLDEFLIDTNIVTVSCFYESYFPAIAFDGANYLVVWQVGNGYGVDIYGARVSPVGNVLDSEGIGIATTGISKWNPSIAFDGTNYLVVWGTDNGGGGYDIYGARVTPSGIVLDTAGIAISTAYDAQRYPSIAFDGINYLVVWQDLRNSTYDIYGARVSPAGVVLDSTGIAISTAIERQLYPCVAFDGTNYLVVWRDLRSGLSFNIYGARVTQGGAVLDPTGIAISTASNWGKPSLSFDGINYLVVWPDNRTGSSLDIYCARINQTGVVLDSAGIAIATAVIPYMPSFYYLAVAFDGTNYLVVWSDYQNDSEGDIYGARVSPAGVVIDPAGIAISTAIEFQYQPCVTFGDTNYLVAWADWRKTSSLEATIYGSRVNQSGIVFDNEGIAIPSSKNEQGTSTITFDGSNYFVLWHDFRSGSSYDIYGIRVTQTGVVLDTISAAISIATNNQYNPSVAFDGANYLVVWYDYRNGLLCDIYGTRMTTTGVVLDSAGIAVSTAAGYQYNPSIAYDGTNYFVVWHDYRSGSSCNIYGTRVSQAGVVLDPAGIAIANAGIPIYHVFYYPAVAFDGTNYLVVWQEGTDPYDIYGARVSPAGVVLDSAGIAISTIVGYQLEPAVTFDGTNYLVVWADNRNGVYEIYGARVSPAGIVLDPAGIKITPIVGDDQRRPAITFDGTNYVVVWQDYINGLSYHIYGARLNQDVTVLEFFAVNPTHPYNSLSPKIAHGTGDTLLITYTGWCYSFNGQPVNTMRVWGRFYYPFFGIEENAVNKISDTNSNLLICPNPFHGTTNIKFKIINTNLHSDYSPQDYIADRTKLNIYNSAGQLVKSFSWPATSFFVPAVISWRGDDDFGHSLPAGVYFCRLITDKFITTKKVVKIK